ncbi:MAG: GNAT family N-acetyltransferase [Aristaeellaceae bacterium]
MYPDGQAGPFAGRGLPEIVDFAVLEKFRGRGVGSRLMDAAEAAASRYADTVYLGVGLHSSYGAAQRMVIRRGHVPDGSGVWYGNQPCPPYTLCRNDADLALYLSRWLGGQQEKHSP